MAMRNTLLTAFGLIALMVVTLIYFGDDQDHGTMVFQESEKGVSIDEARKAYWQRDLPKAERLYRILISANDANINAWGELGNLYYMQVRWPEAAKAYTEATLHLIDNNNMQQAAFLHRLVSQMDRAQSERINQHLRHLQTKQEG